MILVDKNGSGTGRPGLPTNKKDTAGVDKVDLEARTDSAIEEQLVQARASRSQAENARQRIIAEIMEATKELYQKLVNEGEQILVRAKQLEADSELRNLEAHRELEHSNTIRSEADVYREKMIAQTQKQAQEMVQQAQTIKAEAVAFREKLLAQVREQAQQELGQAQSQRIEADAYRERVIAQSQKQAREIMDQARSVAEQEGAEIVQKYSVEAQKVLAQAELVKAAAQEQLEAQRLYAEVANLETESKEVLERARAQLSQSSSLVRHSPKDQSSNSGPSAAPAALGQSPGYKPHQKPGYSLEAANAPLASPAYEEASSQVDLKHSPTVKRRETSASDVAPSKSRRQLPDNALVVGLEIDGRSKAYPLEVVTEARVINDSLNDQDVLVTFGPPSELGMIFKRTVDSRSLNFQALPGSPDGLMLMKDYETGSTWEALTGRAISGELASTELEHLTSEYSFWFAWSDLHPQTEIYSPDQSVQAANVLE